MTTYEFRHNMQHEAAFFARKRSRESFEASKGSHRNTCCATHHDNPKRDIRMKYLPNSKLAVILLAGTLGAGLTGASATTLGGLTSQGVGADDQVVSACDSDGMTSAYTTAYSASAQTYQVTAVTFSGVAAACSAKTASLSLRNGTTNLGTTSGTITVATSSFSMTLASPVTASSVTGLSLVITG